MRLHPDAAAVLERVREAGIPPWHTLTPERAREVYRERALLFQGEKQPAGDVWDTDHPGARPRHPDPRLPARRTTARCRSSSTCTAAAGPSATSTPTITCAAGSRSRPARSSSRWRTDSAQSTARPSSSTTSIVAIRWLREHGAELGGDPTRVAAGGDSAGGNLTAGAALKLRDAGERNIDFQVLIYPATAPYFDTLSYHQNGEGYWLTRGDVIWFWDNFLGPDAGRPPRPVRRPGHP